MRGFTLIELMIVIVIAAVLAGLAAPSFQNIVDANRQATSVNEFMATLNAARQEALKAGRAVIVCRTNAPEASPPACAGGDGWEDGWFIFVDQDGGNDFDAAEPVVAARSALHPSLTLRGNGNIAADITFLASGEVPTSEAGTFTLCAANSTSAREIVVSFQGRARSVKTTAAAAGC